MSNRTVRMLTSPASYIWAGPNASCSCISLFSHLVPNIPHLCHLTCLRPSLTDSSPHINLIGSQSNSVCLNLFALYFCTYHQQIWKYFSLFVESSTVTGSSLGHRFKTHLYWFTFNLEHCPVIYFVILVFLWTSVMCQLITPSHLVITDRRVF